jgi:glycine cleavage system H protein
MGTPKDRKYTKEHEWVKPDNGMAYVGITDHAQSELGDIVYVELPAVGTKVEAGKVLAVVESVKAVSEVFAAIPGEVTTVNTELEQSPELLNKAPYEQHIAVLKVEDGAVDGLLSADEYDAFLAEG